MNDSDADYDQMDDEIVRDSLRKLNKERHKRKKKEKVSLSYAKRNGKETPVIEDPPWQADETEEKTRETKEENAHHTKEEATHQSKQTSTDANEFGLTMKPSLTTEKEGNIRKLTVTLPRVPPPTPTMSPIKTFHSTLPPLKIIGDEATFKKNKRIKKPVVKTTTKQLGSIKPRLYDK